MRHPLRRRALRLRRKDWIPAVATVMSAGLLVWLSLPVFHTDSPSENALLSPVPASRRSVKEKGTLRLRVLTYNVADIPYIHVNSKARLPRIAERVAREGYDIAAFQECWYRWSRKILGASMPDHVRWADGILGGNGLLIGSRFPVSEMGVFTYSIRAPVHRFFYGETDGLSRKGIVAATLETPAGRLKVFDTHMVAGYLGRDYVPERFSQVFELVRFVKAYAGKDPYLLLGDFNFTPKSREYALLSILLGVRDACPECANTVEDRRVDHIFLSQSMSDWRVASASVSFTGTPDDPGGSPLSDHLAVEAVLELPSKAKGEPPFSVTSLSPDVSHSRDTTAAQRQALYEIIRNLDRFCQETAHAIQLNIPIPFYGFSHARWALRQMRTAQHIQSQVLTELRSLNSKIKKRGPTTAKSTSSPRPHTP